MILVRDGKVVNEGREKKKKKKSGHEWKRGIIKYNIHNEDTESGRKRGADVGARGAEEEEEAYR